jgi:hypothetical protein
MWMGLNIGQARECRTKHADGQTVASLAREYGVSPQAMGQILLGRKVIYRVFVRLTDAQWDTLAFEAERKQCSVERVILSKCFR